MPAEKIVCAGAIVGAVEPVDADQERREGLAGPGRRRDQRVAARGDLPPARGLRLGRPGREPALEPGTHGGMKRLEHAPHATCGYRHSGRGNENAGARGEGKAHSRRGRSETGASFYQAPAATKASQSLAIQQWLAGQDPPGRQVGKLRVPTLVADGTLDQLDPTANDRLLAASVPGARLILYPDAGHAFLFQDASSFIPAVERFLD